jgi:hypothetical protein
MLIGIVKPSGLPNDSTGANDTRISGDVKRSLVREVNRLLHHESLINLTLAIDLISLSMHFKLGPLDCAELPRQASPLLIQRAIDVSKRIS